MATNINTVVLFLRRRDNYLAANIRHAVENYFRTLNDVTINNIETPAAKYVAHVWEGLEYTDYITLLQKAPNEKVKAHEIYAEYQKLSAKTAAKLHEAILSIEAEKLLYFILAYPQKVVVVKSGGKDVEKRFLGYEFSNRRGNEGIHAIQRGKNIDECTRLFDAERFDNPDKASTYIYRAFQGDYSSDIAEEMKQHVFRMNLVDMLTFDRSGFEKNVSLATKKKETFSSQWPLSTIDNITESIESGSRPPGGVKNAQEGILSIGGEHIDNHSGYLNLSSPKYVPYNFYEKAKSGIIRENDILLCKDGALTGKVAIVRDELQNQKAMVNEHVFIMRCSNIITQKYLFYLLHSDIGQSILRSKITGTAQGGLNSANLKSLRFPIPPIGVQEKIVTEIDPIESKKLFATDSIKRISSLIRQLFEETQKQANKSYRLSNTDKFKLSIGKRVLTSDLTKGSGIPVISANVMTSFGLIEKSLLTDFSMPSILWGIDGDWMVNYREENSPFYPTDHCGVLRVSDNEIIPRYLAGVLEIAGTEIGFNRSLRASIDRIAGITIMLPDKAIQEKVVSEINKLEAEFTKARTIIEDAANEKQAILDKYL